MLPSPPQLPPYIYLFLTSSNFVARHWTACFFIFVITPLPLLKNALLYPEVTASPPWDPFQPETAHDPFGFRKPEAADPFGFQKPEPKLRAKPPLKSGKVVCHSCFIHAA